MVNSDKIKLSETFKIGGATISDPRAISEHFCEFFPTIGKTVQENIQAAKTPPASHSVKTIKNSMFLTPTDPNEILEIINSLKPKKSVGYDNISTNFLKNIAQSVIHPISILVNKSL